MRSALSSAALAAAFADEIVQTESFAGTTRMASSTKSREPPVSAKKGVHRQLSTRITKGIMSFGRP
jgi:hypothetical protein